MELQSIYARRFGRDLMFRDAMWKILCRDFFQAYIGRGSRVLEIGAGYCEFINNIQAARRIAVDLNPETVRCAAPGVEVVLCDTGHIEGVADACVDVVFASNLFEHLTREQITATIREAYRVLSPGGRFLILQPNIRFCAGDYWMFFDHITAIDDRALVEALETNGFEVLEVIERFLPFTTKSRLPRAQLLIRLYLRFRLAWRFLGQQSFILSGKPR